MGRSTFTVHPDREWCESNAPNHQISPVTRPPQWPEPPPPPSGQDPTHPGDRPPSVTPHLLRGIRTEQHLHLLPTAAGGRTALLVESRQARLHEQTAGKRGTADTRFGRRGEAMDPGEGQGSNLLLNSLQVTALAVWCAILRRDTASYSRVVEFLETVSGAVPTLVTHRHLSKLLLGLRAKIILEMFLQDCPSDDIRSQLGVLFPQDNLLCSAETDQESQKVCEIQKQFRDLVLHLLSNPAFRASFLEVEVREQYGDEFLNALERLLWEYLMRLWRTQEKLSLHQDQRLLRESTCPADLPTIGAVADLHPRCLGLLPSGPSLYPGTPLLLCDMERVRESVESGGKECLEGQWRSKMKVGGQRQPHSPGRRAPLPQRVAEQENVMESGSRCLGERRLDVAAIIDRLEMEIGGPKDKSSEPRELVSDSESESEDPLSACLQGKRPMQLYQRTWHKTLIPTLIQHLQPDWLSTSDSEKETGHCCNKLQMALRHVLGDGIHSRAGRVRVG
ncbi:TERF1-interacting nuclear factor 2-like [Narcine bancroftii]|uniref:TERF1-interacting nuclear factor 2-like n=1 Tax=Narcine bancroftii TaxID=1343680 RepID=UPI0038318841